MITTHINKGVIPLSGFFSSFFFPLVCIETFCKYEVIWVKLRTQREPQLYVLRLHVELIVRFTCNVQKGGEGK